MTTSSEAERIAGSGAEAPPGPESASAGEDLTGAFARWGREGRTALVPYTTAGYPDRATSARLLDSLVEAGADVIELGIPFSDPLADGPTIQRASFRALEEGMTVPGALDLLRDFRQHSQVPVVLFTYLNPLVRYGVERFLEDAAAAGAQGLLLTDLPVGADPELEAKVATSRLDPIRLVAPTTAPSRIPEIARGGRGFLYYISRTGVTGARTELRETLAEEVRRVRGVVDLPVCVGFGISSPEQAAMVAGVAEGVAVGSALIDALDEGGVEGARAFLTGLREGIDRGGRGRETGVGRHA